MERKYLVSGVTVQSVAFDTKEAAEESWRLTYPENQFDFDWFPSEQFARVYRILRRERERIGSICLIDVRSEPIKLS